MLVRLNILIIMGTQLEEKESREEFKERLMTLVNCIDATNKKYVIQQMGGEFKTKYSVKMAVDLMKKK